MRLTTAGLLAVTALLAGCGGATTTVSKKAAEERAALATQAVEAVHSDCGNGKVRLEVHGVHGASEGCVDPKELAAAIKRRCPKGAKTRRTGDHVVCTARPAETLHALHALRTACPKGDVMVGEAGVGAACVPKPVVAVPNPTTFPVERKCPHGFKRTVHADGRVECSASVEFNASP